MAFFGDGAVNNGAFHEGLNLAGIWKLPVLFVCENNQYATEVPFEYAAGNPSVAEPGRVLRHARRRGRWQRRAGGPRRPRAKRVRRARAGGGPTLLECKTYRTRPHAEGMGDFTYRTREEVEEWKARCPILRLKNHLLERQCDDEAEPDAIDSESWPRCEDAHHDAEASRVARSSNGGGPRLRRAGRRAQAAACRALAKSASCRQRLKRLTHEMANNPAIFVMGEGIGKRGGNFNTTAGLYDLYGPERLCDTPICERGFVGLGCGAAMTGARPVIDFMFADFVLDAVGEIVNQIAKMQYMSNGRLQMPILLARVHRHWPFRGNPSLRQLLSNVCPFSRVAGGRALQPV